MPRTHGSTQAALKTWLATGRVPQGRVVCIGDVMLDRFVYGDIQRISPEAPVPILRAVHEREFLGGAGNVVRNVISLGGYATLVTAVGDDADGERIAQLAADLSGLLLCCARDPSRPTTLKTRYVSGNQQILRIDREVCQALREATSRQVRNAANEALIDAQVTILSDYRKGLLSDQDTQWMIQRVHAHDGRVIVDPKGDCYERYRQADVITPNRAELSKAAGRPVDSRQAVTLAAQELLARFEFGAVATTLGEEGILLVTAHNEPRYLPATAQEVFDVAGAGDTVVAGLAVGLLAGLPLDVAVALGNEAAGLAVSRQGTAAVALDEVRHRLLGAMTVPQPSKVVQRTELQELLNHWRERGLSIGFTNGCFDVLHAGHVSLLRQAKSHCDRLIVGVNSDVSVGQLKGSGRPIHHQDARVAVLAALIDTDAVIVFDELTPLSLIHTIRPDVLVKGGDYRADEVVGADVVKRHGGRVVLADVQVGYSTTKIVSQSHLPTATGLLP